jgi:hypothetical protein
LFTDRNVRNLELIEDVRMLARQPHHELKKEIQASMENLRFAVPCRAGHILIVTAHLEKGKGPAEGSSNISGDYFARPRL